MKNNRKLLRELSRLLNVNEKDIPKTLQRFKDEIEDMEAKKRNS